MRRVRWRTVASDPSAGGPPSASRWAIFMRSRSFSLSSSSVNSLAFENMPKNSWLFLAGSSGFIRMILLLSGEGVNLAVEDRVLEGDSRLVDEDPQPVQTAGRASAFRVVA